MCFVFIQKVPFQSQVAQYKNPNVLPTAKPVLFLFFSKLELIFKNVSQVRVFSEKKLWNQWYFFSVFCNLLTNAFSTPQTKTLKTLQYVSRLAGSSGVIVSE